MFNCVFMRLLFRKMYSVLKVSKYVRTYKRVHLIIHLDLPCDNGSFSSVCCLSSFVFRLCVTYENKFFCNSLIAVLPICGFRNDNLRVGERESVILSWHTERCIFYLTWTTSQKGNCICCQPWWDSLICTQK